MRHMRTGLALGALAAVVAAGWLAAFGVFSHAPPFSQSGTQSKAADRTTTTTAPDTTRLSDFNRDGITDLVVRDATGKLWLCPGDGTGGFGARTLMASGLNGMTAIVTPGDVTDDGNADVLARARNGVLWLYQGTGASGFYPRRAIGGG